MKFEEAKKIFFELHNGWTLYDVENIPTAMVQTENTQYWHKSLLPVLIRQNAEIEPAYNKYNDLSQELWNDIETFKINVEENNANELITTKERHEQNTVLYNRLASNLDFRIQEINQSQRIFLDFVNDILKDFKNVLQENGVPEVKIERLIDIPLSEGVALSFISIRHNIDRIYIPYTTPYSKRDLLFYKRWIFNDYSTDLSTTWYWELFHKQLCKKEGCDIQTLLQRLDAKFYYNNDKVTEYIAKEFEEFWEQYELKKIESKREMLLIQELKQNKSEKKQTSILKKWLKGE